MIQSRSPRAALIAAPLAVFVAATAVFWRTAYPTIVWWDSAEYTLAAATLGVIAPPGSLLLTLLGRAVTALPLGMDTAHLLNATAGILAAATVVLVYLAALRIGRNTGTDDRDYEAPTAIGAALGALAFAFGPTTWEHAVKFTPYILTVVFTGLILLTMLRWWEVAEDRDAWRWLALLGFLFGLDFSVHRTNALLIPVVLVWVIIRYPRALAQARVWVMGTLALIAGLVVQLSIIPIAAHTRSNIVMMPPSDWAKFWDYISLADRGGGFLLDFWPRKAAFWSVQVADVARVLRINFAHVSTPAGLAGLLPAISLVVGFTSLWRRNRRLGVALGLAAFLHAAITVIYFNIPANYFRSLDRHYLPVVVLLGAIAAYGSSVAARWVADLATREKRIAAVALATAIVAAPAGQLVGHWATHDASTRHFTMDYARNALESLPRNAIYFTVGDNDTFPGMYLQGVEGVRPDVRIVNLSMASSAWHRKQIVTSEPDFPMSLRGEPYPDPKTWSESTFVVRPAGPGVTPITARLTPLGDALDVSDLVVFDILRTNAWRRPITYSMTAGSFGWIGQFAQLEGTYWRVLPTPDSASSRKILRANLFDRYQYRGYADSSVEIDNETRTMGYMYLSALQELVKAERRAGEGAGCGETTKRFFALVPPERLHLGDAFRADKLCQ